MFGFSSKIKQREKALVTDVREQLPELAKMAQTQRASGVKTIVLHQDAFAADYQDEEYVKLGKAIKYLGRDGFDIHITGTNRETLK